MQTTPLIGKAALAGSSNPAEPAWRALGWFGLVLAFVGLTDAALVFYPARFGDPSWEFGVLSTAVSSMPLLLVGVAALLSSAMARQKRWQARVFAALAILLGVAVLFIFALYLTTVPIALKLAPAEIMAGIYKSIFRTSVMSTVFAATFIGGGVMTIRSIRSPQVAR